MVVVHLSFLAFSAAAILFADKHAVAWMRGKQEVLSKSSLQWIHYAVWIGLLGMIASGLYMAYPILGFLTKNPIFVMKMLFVGILVVNAILIDSLMKVAYTRSFASLTFKEKIPLFASGAISMSAWIGAAVLGYFFL